MVPAGPYLTTHPAVSPSTDNPLPSLHLSPSSRPLHFDLLPLALPIRIPSTRMAQLLVQQHNSTGHRRPMPLGLADLSKQTISRGTRCSRTPFGLGYVSKQLQCFSGGLPHLAEMLKDGHQMPSHVVSNSHSPYLACESSSTTSSILPKFSLFVVCHPVTRLDWISHGWRQWQYLTHKMKR